MLSPNSTQTFVQECKRLFRPSLLAVAAWPACCRVLPDQKLALDLRSLIPVPAPAVPWVAHNWLAANAISGFRGLQGDACS